MKKLISGGFKVKIVPFYVNMHKKYYLHFENVSSFCKPSTMIEIKQFRGSLFDTFSYLN